MRYKKNIYTLNEAADGIIQIGCTKQDLYLNGSLKISGMTTNERVMRFKAVVKK